MRGKPADTAGQRGQSMVELLVILPVMLLLIFATIQMALIYHAKITLNYAAYEAVRAGTLTCDKRFGEYDNRCVSEVDQFTAVKEGFARGLAPLYSYFDPERRHESGLAANQVEAFQQGRARIYREFDSKLELIRIERLNPTARAFSGFAEDGVIPNDNLTYRTQIAGGGSKMSIQDANLLHLRITYWYPLHVPLVNRLMFDAFICCKGDADSWCRWQAAPACSDDVPRIPLTATAVMRMQAPVENGDGYAGSPQP